MICSDFLFLTVSVGCSAVSLGQLKRIELPPIASAAYIFLTASVLSALTCIPFSSPEPASQFPAVAWVAMFYTLLLAAFLIATDKASP